MFKHGPSECFKCWAGQSSSTQHLGSFRLVRDAGHWGASDPRVLVLGISKGNTQAQAFRFGNFDDVAFKGVRHRLLAVLQSVSLLLEDTPSSFEKRFGAAEQDFAFASVVRCSLTGLDKSKGIHTADSPNVIPVFQQNRTGNVFVRNCVDQHLVELPSRTRTILLLGNTDKYVEAMSETIASRRGPVRVVNSMSYESAGVRFVHLAHPSKGNGHFGNYIRGEGKSGAKRNQAREALSEPYLA